MMNTATGLLEFEPPVLPDPRVSRTLIQQAVAYEVRGRVSAVAGESVEIEGMTAPIGAICELKSQDGAITRSRVIGFRGVRPILAPLERLNALAAGDSVRLVDTTLKLRVGPSLCGRVIDAFGQPADGKPLPKDLMTVDAERQHHGGYGEIDAV